MLASCTYGKLVEIRTDPDLPARFAGELQKLETELDLPFRGTYTLRTVHANDLDAEGYAIAKHPKRGWGTAWVEFANDDERSIAFAVTFVKLPGKTIPDRVLRHEALHLILVSRGTVGHPEIYRHHAWRWSDRPELDPGL